ncbi:hypothetical protein [Thermoflavimicrobium daqui]|uniref:Uncharacterized protein n=1 Tax=Thermoflavimicrobium daqui TaxID=2137476 RepID=A0A364K4X5_9BACL|nr:hypothetical protein [Thermoflavimicrobium daqui]RAL24387.1 hypothetical protein DL897_08660 [Thermoflavimicrobium daqui]
MHLNENERNIVIRALTKVLETEPPYARADEYKKLLERLKREQIADDVYLPEHSRYDIDDV